MTRGTRSCCSSYLAWLLLFRVLASCHSTAPSGVLAMDRRRLAMGDFDELNELLVGAVIRLPDATVTSNSITLDMTNLRCTNFRIDDFLVQSSSQNVGETNVRIDIEGLDMLCYLDYVYTFLFTRQGSADMVSSNNRASVAMSFESPTYKDSVFHPTTSTVRQCDPEVNIDDLRFRGDISAFVLDIIKGLIIDKVEAEAEKRICEELRSLSSTFIADLLERVDNILAQYPAEEVFDPLLSETKLAVPENVALINFQDKSSVAAKWLDRMLADAMQFAKKEVEDDIIGRDMNLNVLIRENLLSEDRGLLLDVDDVQFFQRHDKFTETEIVLDSVKVFGLDTLSAFEPLVDIGKHTMQNKVSWDLLAVEMDVTIDVKASTKRDSVFVLGPGSGNGVQERVKIKFGLENVDAVVSILLAVDEGKLGGLHLGSLLDTDKIFDCLLSTTHELKLSGLSLEVGDIQPPTMEGFVSRGIDRVVSNSVDAAFVAYESTLLEAAPSFFQTTVRSLLNKKFLNSFKADTAIGRECSSVEIASSENGFIDFRDLFLPANEALAAGGSGTQPYGDVVYTIVSQFKERFLANDQDGSPKINSIIRAALSQAFNTTEAGVYVGDVMSWNTTLAMAGLKAVAGVDIVDARIENLDSFGKPLELLEPVTGEGNMLNNTASIGVGSKPVRLAARLLISLSDDADLQLRNEVAVSLDLSEARIIVVLLLHILEKPFFSVPLEDTLNLNCWLATILPDSSSDVNGTVLLQQELSIERLHLNISCVSCTSPDFDELIYQLYSPNDFGNATSKILNLVNLLRESDYLRVAADEFIRGASKQCPHNTEYDPNFSLAAYFVKTGGGLNFAANERDEKAVLFNVATAVVAVCLILIFFVVKVFVRRRYRMWLAALPSADAARLRRRETAEKEREADLNENTQSMFQSQHLPRHTRLLVPFVLFVTIGIQLGGHLAVLSTVDVVGQIAGEPFAVSEFLVFSFIRASVRTFNNGGSEMAILLFMFTGVWPYIKLVTSLALWFIPPRMVSVSRRESIFLWLDVFAKLSIVDIFTMLILVAAFLVYIGGVDERMTASGEFFATKLIIVPGAGFYCIIIAQRITRISSRYLLDCHHQIVDSATRDWQDARNSLRTLSTESWDVDEEVEDGLSDSPSYSHCEEVDDDIDGDADPEIIAEADSKNSSHIMSKPDQAECGVRTRSRSLRLIVKPSLWRHIAVGFTGLTVLILAIIGCVLAPAISLDTKAVWGLFESGKTYEEAVNEFPVFRVICSILVQARFVLDSAAEKVGLGFLLVLVVVTATAFPTMKAIAYLRRWNHQRRNGPRNATTICSMDILSRFKQVSSLLCPWYNGSQGRASESLSLDYLRRWNHQRRNGTRSATTICSMDILSRFKQASSLLCRWYNGSQSTRLDGDTNLLPAYRLKAWQNLEVYIIAFVIACWQLGAVATYAIHNYCFILERIFDTLVFLGLVEKTSAQCFREQASSPSTVLIICAACLVLLASFLFQAVGQYRKVMSSAQRDMAAEDLESEKGPIEVKGGNDQSQRSRTGSF